MFYSGVRLESATPKLTSIALVSMDWHLSLLQCIGYFIRTRYFHFFLKVFFKKFQSPKKYESLKVLEKKAFRNLWLEFISKNKPFFGEMKDTFTVQTINRKVFPKLSNFSSKYTAIDYFWAQNIQIDDVTSFKQKFRLCIGTSGLIHQLWSIPRSMWMY